MEIENYIEKIIDDGNIENMHKLSEILDGTMKIIQKYDEDCYKKYEMELYKMAYGENLSREMAEHIVKEMRPYGMKWNLEQTRQIQQQYGIDNVNPVDFYIVLNSAFNDYNNLFDDNIEKYIKFTLDFINDEDAKEGKVFKYFTIIPNN